MRWMSASDKPPRPGSARGRLVLGLDVDDAVGVDVERYLDLRHAARQGGMPTRSNCPSSLLSAAISRSPWKTGW
jgi:hypothetical protein